nr:fused MFS/spermidine synthase [Sphingomonas jinjuensis]
MTILTGSFLLFLVQPMVARMALPRLGGAPAVWNSAMLVYQTLLLGGYAYAHWLGRWRPRVQAGVHLALLIVAALWLPIGLIGGEMPADSSPAWWVPWLLVASIGPLFLAVSAQAPLVQRWFALASGGREPWALYAASNLGSFAGLIAYPLVVEPLLPLRVQSLAWTAGYALVILLVVACARTLPAESAARIVPVSPRAVPRRVAWWIALAFVPSGLMLATSTYITTDIVAMPLLWVLPLGLYLLSFTIAFSDKRDTADFLTRVAPITILLFGGVIMGGFNKQPLANVAVALVLLFMVSVGLHTALYRARPAADRLTGFYLAMAVGGALGGVFAGLLAPILFDWTYEFPLLILAAGALVPQLFLTGSIRRVWHDATARRIAWLFLVFVLVVLTGLTFRGPPQLFGEGHQGLTFVVIAAVGLATIGVRAAYTLVLAAALLMFGGGDALHLSLGSDARSRSYFGVYTIRDTAEWRELDHGTTIHGLQLTGSAARETSPTTYYAPSSGVGQAMTLASSLYGTGARIGVVGLGTGTLACYARPRQQWRFYEIDPEVVRIARDSGRFTFLRRCRPDADIEMGDARLSLTRDPPASLDLLALDAFSSDSIPMHLMTREAFAAYARVLTPNGLLLVHISNRFLDLEPVVDAAARAGGWQAVELYDRPSLLEAGANGSQWVALSRDPAAIAALRRQDRRWRPLVPVKRMAPWTDDYASILPLLRW